LNVIMNSHALVSGLKAGVYFITAGSRKAKILISSE
jgi:hypothetical protein